jgi:hypothetical protein
MSLIGMTKIKMSKEDTVSAEFVEQRRAALERHVSVIFFREVYIISSLFCVLFIRLSAVPVRTVMTVLRFVSKNKLDVGFYLFISLAVEGSSAYSNQINW